MKLWIVLLAVSSHLCAQTIGEKRLSIEDKSGGLERAARVELGVVNRTLDSLHDELKALYEEGRILLEAGGTSDDFASLTSDIRNVKIQIEQIAECWKEEASSQGHSDPYALFHQPWTSIEQLVMDYGSFEYVYIIPPEVGGIRMSVTSNIPVPKESWGDVLELILASNGVGVRQLNPYLRALYLVDKKPGHAAYVTDSPHHLDSMPPTAQVCYVLSPSSLELGTTKAFFDKFLDPFQGQIHQIGRQLFISTQVATLQELLKLYDFVEGGQTRGYEMVSLSKMNGEEMKRLLEIHFETTEEVNAGLKVYASPDLPGAVYLAGPSPLLREAKKVIEEVEGSVQNPNKKEIFRYKVKHSDPEELAEVLGQVYQLLLNSQVEQGRVSEASDGNIVIAPKTNNLVMVVEQDLLPSLQALIQKLDVPKKMVKIDVLLFEKRIDDKSQFGLDLLKLGACATGSSSTGFGFGAGKGLGLTQFLLSAVNTSITPAFDLVYSFLMSRDDVRINSHPSVTTVNNTEATIELLDEISIDMGSYTDNDTKRKYDHSFSRQRYGITINITPIINAGEDPLDPDFITLQTDVLFDTILTTGAMDRPPVLRRHVINEVRVKDGETVIMGGLRSKTDEDSQTGLPFLSEIPYLGKLFGHTELRDRDREMYIFITPHIIEDSATELHNLRCEELKKRPGDTPEFLKKLSSAKARQRNGAFERTLHSLFGN